jgi:hypothetical protein
MGVGDVADVLEVDAASIFRVGLLTLKIEPSYTSDKSAHTHTVQQPRKRIHVNKLVSAFHLGPDLRGWGGGERGGRPGTSTKQK